MNPFDLTGRVALVTGGARGIGLSVAQVLAGQGADVVVVDIADDAPDVTALAAQFPERRVRYQRVDVRDADAVAASVEGVVTELGSVDILVNNAGTASRNGLATISDDEWYRDLDTNLRGMFLYCRAVEPHMRARGSGRIINVSSISGSWAAPGPVARVEGARARRMPRRRAASSR